MNGAGWVDEEQLTDGVIGRRLWGWMVDIILIAALLGILHVVLAVIGFLTFGLGWFLLGGLWIVPIAYSFGFVLGPTQATPGQALLGLRVVRDEDLGLPSPAQALVYAGGFALTMAAGAVWVLVALVSRRSRCLHDMLSGLVVVRARALPPDAAFRTAEWAATDRPAEGRPWAR